MIAPETTLTPHRLERTLPVWMEHAVRCGADAEIVVRAILSAMEQYPFGVSDGLAVQLGVRETLAGSLPVELKSGIPRELRVRTSLTSSSVRVQIDNLTDLLPQKISAEEVSDRSEQAAMPPDISQRLRLARTYMTSIEILPEKRRIILYRARGQGSAVSSLPRGYDFQI